MFSFNRLKMNALFDFYLKTLYSTNAPLVFGYGRPGQALGRALRRLCMAWVQASGRLWYGLGTSLRVINRTAFGLFLVDKTAVFTSSLNSLCTHFTHYRNIDLTSYSRALYPLCTPLITTTTYK